MCIWESQADHGRRGILCGWGPLRSKAGDLHTRSLQAVGIPGQAALPQRAMIMNSLEMEESNSKVEWVPPEGANALCMGTLANYFFI